MHRRVVRIGRILRIMREDPGIVNYPLLDPALPLLVVLGAPEPEFNPDTLEQLQNPVRKKSDFRGFLSALEDLRGEVVPVDESW